MIEINKTLNYDYQFTCDNCGKKKSVSISETVKAPKPKYDIKDSPLYCPVKIPNGWFKLLMCVSKTGDYLDTKHTETHLCSKKCMKQHAKKEIDTRTLQLLTE